MEVLNLTEGKKFLLVNVEEIPIGMNIHKYLEILVNFLKDNGVLNTLVGIHESKYSTKKSRIPRKLKKCIQESYKKIIENEKNKMDCGSKK